MPHILSKAVPRIRLFALLGLLAFFTIPGRAEEPDMSKRLRLAAETGNVARLTALLDQGVPVDLPSPTRGETALMYAANAGQLKVIEFLVSRGAQVNFKSASGRTALFWAAFQQFPDCVAALLAAGADPNVTDAEGETPVFGAAWGKRKVLELLLAANPNINIVSKAGWSPLMRAAWANKPENVSMLVKAGADIDLENADGETALIKAGQRGHMEEVEYFVTAGAKKNSVFLNKSVERDETLTAAQRWGLAASALIAQAEGYGHETLGAGPASAKPQQIAKLRNEWLILNREQLLLWLDWYCFEGSRVRFQKDLPPLETAAVVEGFKGVRQKEDFARAAPPVERSEYIAWDLCQFIALARIGYSAGYLTADEAWQKIMPVAQRLQRHFKSWEEMGQDFMAGREKWLRHADPSYASLYKLMICKEEPNSPWNKTPWATSLRNPGK